MNVYATHKYDVNANPSKTYTGVKVISVHGSMVS
jgi:hypothetical protein